MGKLGTYLKRGREYVKKGVPNKVTTVNISQINYGGGLLKDKKVLITGGTRGLGFAMAQKALSEGAKVTITGRTMEGLQKAKKEMGNPKNLFLLEHDLSDVAKAPEIVHEARVKMAGIDILVNNAGISIHGTTYATLTEEQWDEQMDINLKGTYFMTQAFMNYYEEVNKKQGKIINIVSERGLYGDDVPYGLAKRALISFTEGLAVRLITKGVRVNAIAPGVVATDMTGHSKDDNLFRPYCKGRRILVPEEIAEVACFLMSDASNCISGQVIACNEANHLMK